MTKILSQIEWSNNNSKINKKPRIQEPRIKEPRIKEPIKHQLVKSKFKTISKLENSNINLKIGKVWNRFLILTWKCVVKREPGKLGRFQKKSGYNGMIYFSRRTRYHIWNIFLRIPLFWKRFEILVFDVLDCTRKFARW